MLRDKVYILGEFRFPLQLLGALLSSMEKGNYINIFLLSVCLATITGCTAGSVSPIKGAGEQSSVVNNTYSYTTIILSKLTSMKSGQSDSAENVSFVAGEIYTAASGNQCRPVNITVKSDVAVSSGSRVACNDGQNWFFSEDVFLTGSVSDGH